MMKKPQSTFYPTKKEAILEEIVNPLGSLAEHHNVDAIADTLITRTTVNGCIMFQADKSINFWELVENNTI